MLSIGGGDDIDVPAAAMGPRDFGERSGPVAVFQGPRRKGFIGGLSRVWDRIREQPRRHLHYLNPIIPPRATAARMAQIFLGCDDLRRGLFRYVPGGFPATPR